MTAVFARCEPNFVLTSTIRRPTYVIRARRLQLRHASTKLAIPSSVTSPTSNHDSLKSFQDYADRVGLDRSRSVYRGTHYEYTVQNALQRLGFTLLRIGGTSDGGIDLIGHWALPFESSGFSGVKTAMSPLAHRIDSREHGAPPENIDGEKGEVQQSENERMTAIRVFVQCKALNRSLQPNSIRELSGAKHALPLDWRQAEAFDGDNATLALLATTFPATAGVMRAVGQSHVPMGFLKITEDGVIEQFLWNHAATKRWLIGLGTVLRYASSESGDIKRDVVLTWKGEPVESLVQN